jgi:hypothetical protein
MQIFGLLYTDALSGTCFNFPLRCAETVADYLVDLLLRTQLDPVASNCWVFRSLLADVVLRHVHGLDPGSLSVSGYDAETASLVLLDGGYDADVDVLPLPVSESGDERVFELCRAARYVVPVSKVLEQMAMACEDRMTWEVMQNEDIGPCSRLPQFVPMAAAAAQAAEAEPVEVDAETAGLNPGTPKRRRMDESDTD